MTAIESAWNRALSWLGRFIKWTPLSATAARLLRHVREPSMPSMVEYWSGYYRLGAEHGIPRIKKTRDHSWAHDIPPPTTNIRAPARAHDALASIALAVQDAVEHSSGDPSRPRLHIPSFRLPPRDGGIIVTASLCLAPS